MKRERLVALLNAIFGSQTEASRQLKTSPRTIAAWGKENPVPPAVAELLQMLAEARGITS